MANHVFKGALPKQLRKDMDDMAFQTFGKYETEWSASGLWKVSEFPKNGTYTTAEISGLNQIREIPEGGAPDMDVPVEGHEKSMTSKQVGGALQITQIALEDEMFGKLKAMSSELAVALNYYFDLAAWDLFYSGGTATTGQLAWDGLPLFYYHVSAGHKTLKTDESVDNRPSSDAALSETSLLAAMQYFINGVLSEEGRPLNINYDKLVITSKDHFIAKRLQSQEVGTAANDSTQQLQTNSKMGAASAFTIFESKILTKLFGANKGWFLVDSKNLDFRWKWKRKPMTDEGYEALTGNRFWKITSRFGVAGFDYKPGYGSYA